MPQKTSVLRDILTPAKIRRPGPTRKGCFDSSATPYKEFSRPQTGEDTNSSLLQKDKNRFTFYLHSQKGGELKCCFNSPLFSNMYTDLKTNVIPDLQRGI